MKREKELARRPMGEAVELPVADTQRKNEYYIAVARRFGFLRLMTLAVLVIYILLMIMIRGDDITVANLKYLFRDINISSSAGAAFSEVDYTAEPIQRFAIYRGELMYVTGSEVKFFSATGSVGLTSSVSYESPMIISTDKYAMIYDIGGNGFSVYNSFSELYRESTDGAVVSATLSESGSFAVLTSGSEHKSIIYIYGDDFELRTKYSKNEYVTDILLSADGARLAMASVSATSGRFVTKLTLYEQGDAPFSEITIAEDYPCALRLTDNGFVLVGREKLYFYDFNGVCSGIYDPSGKIGSCDVHGKYTVLVCPENTLATQNRIVILDSSASVVYDKVLDEKITDVSVDDHGEAFVLTSSRAVMIDIEASSEKALPLTSGTSKRIIAAGDQTALVCTSSSAFLADFSSLAFISN